MKIFFFAKALILIFLILFSLVSFCVLINRGLPRPGALVLGLRSALPTHPLVDFNSNLFYQGVGRAEADWLAPSYKIYGGIVPHHGQASYLIAKLFSSLKLQNPRVIVLIGPNHRDVGKFNALTSFYGWETPFGILEPADPLIRKLVNTGLAQEDEDAFTNEQSVGTIVPYIKYFLPDTKIVPIILKSDFDLKDGKNLANFLTEFSGDGAVIVASIDFSHYLTGFEAREKDRVILEAIKSYDVRKILSFNSDFLDSPGSLVTLLMSMENIQKTGFEVLNHTNSGEILGNGVIPTTSYFLLAFH